MKANKYLRSCLAQFLLEKNVSEKGCREKKHTFTFSNFLSSEILPFMRMWKNTVESDRPQMTTWCTRIACCKTKATDTQSEYVNPITLPLQQWLHGRASMSRYTYKYCQS